MNSLKINTDFNSIRNQVQNEIICQERNKYIKISKYNGKNLNDKNLLNDLFNKLLNNNFDKIKLDDISYIFESFKDFNKDKLVNPSYQNINLNNIKIFVIGSLYSNHDSCNKILNYFIKLEKENQSDKVYIFLGNYIENNYSMIFLLLKIILFKLLYGNNTGGKVFLLRGQTETFNNYQIFRNIKFELDNLFKNDSIIIYNYLLEIFNYFPITLKINENFFVNGGPASNLDCLNNDLKNDNKLPYELNCNTGLSSCIFNKPIPIKDLFNSKTLIQRIGTPLIYYGREYLLIFLKSINCNNLFMTNINENGIEFYIDNNIELNGQLISIYSNNFISDSFSQCNGKIALIDYNNDGKATLKQLEINKLN